MLSCNIYVENSFIIFLFFQHFQYFISLSFCLQGFILEAYCNFYLCSSVVKVSSSSLSSGFFFFFFFLFQVKRMLFLFLFKTIIHFSILADKRNHSFSIVSYISNTSMLHILWISLVKKRKLNRYLKSQRYFKLLFQVHRYMHMIVIQVNLYH